MTETNSTPTPDPVPSTRAKLTMTAVDIGTVGLGFAFAVAACQKGPVAGGIAVAAVTTPIVYSCINSASRILPAWHPVADLGNYTGIKLSALILKDAFSNAKSAAIATAVLGVVGLVAGGLVSGVKEKNEYWQEIHNRPTLPGNTAIRNTPVRAEELCVKHHYSYEIPYTAADGKQYKIVCP